MRFGRLLTLVLVAGLCTCSSAPPSTTSELTHLAKHVVRYDGPEIQVRLEYWWADDYLSKTQLMLKLSLIVDEIRSTVVERDAIKVRNPDGRMISLVDPKEFQRLYPELLSAPNLFDVWGPPPEIFTGVRKNCGRWFLSPPGDFRDNPFLTVTPGRWCSGPLVFAVPEGVRPGRWVLIIDLEESDVQIPFTLGR